MIFKTLCPDWVTAIYVKCCFFFFQQFLYDDGGSVAFCFSRAFESELRMYDGDDPLDVWDR